MVSVNQPLSILPEKIKTLTVSLWLRWVPSHPHIVRTGRRRGRCWKARAREDERTFTRISSPRFDSELQFMNAVACRRLSNIINRCISLQLLSGTKSGKGRQDRQGRPRFTALQSWMSSSQNREQCTACLHINLTPLFLITSERREQVAAIHCH